MDWTRILAMLLAGVVLGAACRPQNVERQEVREVPTRIVSMAPSLTESLFALGVGDRVVGRTRYCSFPPEVAEIPEIGGHLDPNIEAIIALRPDLVFTIPSSGEAEARLRSLGIRVLPVDQHDVAAVLKSVTVLAEACGVPERGVALRARLEQKLETVRRAVQRRPRPRVVVVVGRELGEGAVRSVWAAGPETFYEDVVGIAGGVNAVTPGLVRYPEISREGLVALDPDVILDVVSGLDKRGLDAEEVRADWSELGELRAVREDKVCVLVGDAMVVPGPRLPELVNAVAKALHPELAWEGR
ncbi:MAG: helical backbone metal receptor [Acidobacteriota bacterium]